MRSLSLITFSFSNSEGALDVGCTSVADGAMKTAARSDAAAGELGYPTLDGVNIATAATIIAVSAFALPNEKPRIELLSPRPTYTIEHSALITPKT
jgi:hypothetical protein